MKYPLFIAGVVGAAMVASSVGAADLQGQISGCLAKHANPRQAANIMLSCTAADGKLSNCTVVESDAPSKGFEAAAMCVAAVLPMGAKTGPVRVPVRFPGGG